MVRSDGPQFSVKPICIAGMTKRLRKVTPPMVSGVKSGERSGLAMSAILPGE
jgi:hypothetical protein